MSCQRFGENTSWFYENYGLKSFSPLYLFSFYYNSQLNSYCHLDIKIKIYTSFRHVRCFLKKQLKIYYYKTLNIKCLFQWFQLFQYQANTFFGMKSVRVHLHSCIPAPLMYYKHDSKNSAQLLLPSAEVKGILVLFWCRSYSKIDVLD